MLEATEKLVKVVPLSVVWPPAGTENKYLIIQITETIERICNCHLPAAAEAGAECGGGLGSTLYSVSCCDLIANIDPPI